MIFSCLFKILHKIFSDYDEYNEIPSSWKKDADGTEEGPVPGHYAKKRQFS